MLFWALAFIAKRELQKKARIYDQNLNLMTYKYTRFLYAGTIKIY